MQEDHGVVVQKVAAPLPLPHSGSESGAKALSSKMTPGMAFVSFFLVFEASKMKFRNNFAGGTHSKLSFPSQKCL